jgi:hypothetical protein
VDSVPYHLKFLYLILVADLTSYLELESSLTARIFKSCLVALAISSITVLLEITTPLLGTT